MHRQCTSRCNSTEFNANGQLFFQPLLQAMRIMVNFGETLPDSSTDSYQISAKLLLLWAFTILMLMLATFGIGAASGVVTAAYKAFQSRVQIKLTVQ